MVDGAKKPVLIVEDEGYVTEVLCRIFSRFPQLEVFHATEAESAKRLLEERNPELIIQDVYVPGISGLELLRAAKQKNPKVCVIMITGSLNTDLAKKAVSEGAWDFVIKPPELERVESLVKLWNVFNP